MGKVPALQHGNTMVTETGAILAYLADLYPEKKLAPALGSAERGSYYRCCSWWRARSRRCPPPRPKAGCRNQTERQALSAGYGRFDDVLRSLQLAVSGKRYACGDHFTAADLYLASYIGWSMHEGTLPSLPEFQDYALPLLQRPSAQRADALDGPAEMPAAAAA
ncbi:glutathione S-transferase family protein [Comamonas sp. JC664]|uniref:glutathione S-transferase family protein n=1 Tax=Comamonas sp. JC664 TaxID=2801917 RepID=UPI0036134DFB